MEQIIVRKATLDDMDTLLLFEQGVIAAERPFDITLKNDPIRYYDIEKMITAAHVELLVATLNSTIIGSGYARIENAKPFLRYEQYAYLGFMYVLPEYRGKGVNKLIIDALAGWSASKNITELRLEVYQNNEPAIKAYEKTGFTKLLVEMRMEIKSNQ
ncbi:GNAT family N-acetyltransferase [Ferruginibacter sp. SUN106]|uniref:GNAT family N-acetyltransferase n=1 Tax=Ferruginibacter sp. SUN106 TaxID=2978348 RepID=UPI003D369FD7